MTNIISRAKDLLNGATPGPWMAADSDIISPGKGFIGTISEYSGLIDGSEEQANARLVAAAPEMARVLAEETWEYGVQLRTGSKDWHFVIPFAQRRTRKFCERFIESCDNNPRFVYRMVRRRTSPVEVVGSSKL